MTGRRYYLTNLAAWQRHAHRCAESHFVVIDAASERGTDRIAPATAGIAATILVLVSGDEAAHIALESDAECEALPHPLSRTPVSERVAAALAPFGVVQGDDTFTVAEKLARVNPLLRHRVF